MNNGCFGSFEKDEEILEQQPKKSYNASRFLGK